jgi:anionic cell wall polymer biosynthesis LytR-Cps2A-Psr (LCP) family protein
VKPEVPTKVLVVVTAPNKDASQVAALPFLLQVEGRALVPVTIDPEQRVQVPGTSAQTLADAYPFGGGKAVAEAYAQISSQAVPEWVAITPDTWIPLVDGAKGIELTVPQGISSYTQGKLTILQAGDQTLSGAEVAALISALDYLPADQRETVRSSVQKAVAGVVIANFGKVTDGVRSGHATSSLRPEILSALASGLK